MSRYNYCDTSDRIFFKKDEHTAKELIISEDACYRLNNLEAQLEEANHINTWIKKQQESWNSTTKETIEDLERKLEEARERLTIAINCMPQLAKINYEQDCK